MAALLSVTATVPSVAAEAMRCNMRTDSGIYKPVLRIVGPSGSQDIFVGEQGLSRAIFYRDSRVRRYIQGELGVTLNDARAAINSLCGRVDDRDDRLSEPAVVPDPKPLAVVPDLPISDELEPV